MSEALAVGIAYGAAAITALVAAFREDIWPKVQKLALAVAFAAIGFLIQATDWFK
jgi:hypothetical protein